tara:strand:- start:5333 stop:6085 length:753 start_codon:yes stop_codon:yes gene_type:complete
MSNSSKKIDKIKSEIKKLGYDIESGEECFIPLEFLDDGDGNFNYDLYKKVQSGLNKQKIHHPGPEFSSASPMIKHINKNIKNINFGICHGTRAGGEQKSLRKTLGISVLGTDIADSATRFEDTIQWDFHEIKDDWVDNVSFIYTNSIDHAYDPIKALGNWMKCLHVTGCIYLEMGLDKKPTTQEKGDPKWLSQEKYDKKLPYNLADCFRCTHSFIEKLVSSLDTENAFKVINETGWHNSDKTVTIIQRLK